MNEQMFMGVDYSYWTLLCLVVAVFYYFLWPRPSVHNTRTPWQHRILRYFHALVWIFLAAASLVRDLYLSDTAIFISDILLLLALITYLIFLYTFLQEKRKIAHRKK